MLSWYDLLNFCDGFLTTTLLYHCNLSVDLPFGISSLSEPHVVQVFSNPQSGGSKVMKRIPFFLVEEWYNIPTLRGVEGSAPLHLLDWAIAVLGMVGDLWWRPLMVTDSLTVVESPDGFVVFKKTSCPRNRVFKKTDCRSDGGVKFQKMSKLQCQGVPWY